MKTKLTLISITFRGRKYTAFVQAEYDLQGKARISEPFLNRVLNAIGVRRGDTYTIG